MLIAVALLGVFGAASTEAISGLKFWLDVAVLIGDTPKVILRHLWGCIGRGIG